MTARAVGKAVLAVLLSASASAAGSLSGRVVVGVEGLSLRDAGAIVVFIEPLAVDPSLDGAALPAAEVRQRGARFDPLFLAVAAGQRVDMPNDDIIYHNVFSYSEPNDFDLGLYAAGKSKSLHFKYPGVVRFYCSIHEAMDGLIFVAPTRLFSTADASGHYAIGEIPHGRYQLHVWSERLPELVQSIEIAGDVTAQLELGATR